MGDKITKFLRALPEKQQRQLIEIMEQIFSGNFTGLDVKKLTGRDQTYRVRKGDFRIIFLRKGDEEPRITAVERRSDTTYRF